MTPSRFRQLLWLYVALTIAALVVSSLPGGYSQQLADAYESEPDPWLLGDVWQSLGLAVLFGVAGTAGLVGLFLFKAWGRSLSLVCTFAGLIMVAFSGPTLTSALEDALWSSSEILWGAALAAAYFSPVAAQFASKDPTRPQVEIA